MPWPVMVGLIVFFAILIVGCEVFFHGARPYEDWVRVLNRKPQPDGTTELEPPPVVDAGATSVSPLPETPRGQRREAA